MSTVKIQYSTVRNGKRYWELGDARQKKSGLSTAVLPAYEALGEDNLKTQQKALAYYDAYKEALKAEPEDRLGGWPAGSLGACFHLYKQTEDWTVDKKERTRDQWEEAWAHISRRFGRTLITRITVADSEKFHRDCRRLPVDAAGKKTEGLGLSPHEAWRTCVIWRALLNMLEKKDLIPKAPIGAVANPMPPGRGEFWLESEVACMVRAAALLERVCRSPAEKKKFRTLGLIVRLAWETALSAVDCRTFSMAMLKPRPGGWYVDRARTKNGAAAKPPLSTALLEALQAYAKELPAEMVGDAPLFRNSDGVALSRSYLSHAFAELRRVAFGKAEKRQLQDLRRSANLEADMGDAKVEDRAALLANTMDKSKSLDAVYTPATTLRGLKVQKARETGRVVLQQEFGRKAK
jgi:hypothetical protein